MTNTLALLRLLPMSGHDKDAEILALRHQIMVLERRLHGDRVRFTPADRAWLAALLHALPRTVLHHLRLPVRPDTVLRWHRDLIARRHARRSRPKRPGRATHDPVDPPARPAPGPGEQHLGISPRARRAPRPGRQGRWAETHQLLEINRGTGSWWLEPVEVPRSLFERYRAMRQGNSSAE